MNKRSFVLFMTIAIFTNLQAKELEDLLQNYSDTISEKIEDKIINENIVNEIDKFGKPFIENNADDDKNEKFSNHQTKNDDEDDDSNDQLKLQKYLN